MVSELIQRQFDRFLDEAVTHGERAVAEDSAKNIPALDPKHADALT